MNLKWAAYENTECWVYNGNYRSGSKVRSETPNLAKSNLAHAVV